MESKRFNELLDQTIDNIKKLAQLKGGEYAGDADDRLINFKRNAERLGLAKEQVWGVYAGKHWDAVNQYIKDKASGRSRERLESISGRADDLIVYLTLFKAMVEENESNVSHKEGVYNPLINQFSAAYQRAKANEPWEAA